MQEHLQTCDKKKCKNTDFGCNIQGTVADLELHEPNCQYEIVTNVFDKTEKMVEHKIQPLLAKIDSLENTIDHLRATVDILEKNQNHQREIFAQNQTKLTNEVRIINSKLADRVSHPELARSETQHTQVSTWAPNQGPNQLKCRGTFVGHQKTIWALLIHGDYLYSGSSDLTIKVWDTTITFRCEATLQGHIAHVISLAATGKYLFSGSTEGTIRAWSTENFVSLGQLQHGHKSAHGFGVSNLCAVDVCSENSSLSGILFSGSKKELKIWHVFDNEQTGSNDDVQGVSFDTMINDFSDYIKDTKACQMSNELYVCSGNELKSFRLYTYENLRKLVVDTSFPSIGIMNYGSTLSGASGDGDEIQSCAVTNHFVVVGTKNKTILVYDKRSFQLLKNLTSGSNRSVHKVIPIHTGCIHALAIFPGNHGDPHPRLLSASEDKSIRLWSLTNFVCTQSLIRHDGSVFSLAVSHNGRIFSGSADNTVKVWQ